MRFTRVEIDEFRRLMQRRALTASTRAAFVHRVLTFLAWADLVLAFTEAGLIFARLHEDRWWVNPLSALAGGWFCYHARYIARKAEELRAQWMQAREHVLTVMRETLEELGE